jgi:hypothetical protein
MLARDGHVVVIVREGGQSSNACIVGSVQIYERA